MDIEYHENEGGEVSEESDKRVLAAMEIIEEGTHGMVARIAELEAGGTAYDAGYQAAKADMEERVYRADSALAQRDRMLGIAAYHAWESGSVGMGIDQMPEGYPDFYLADLRVRAEEWIGDE